MHQITVDGNKTSFVCSPQSNLLAAMLAAGVNIIPVGCRAGGCGICKIHVLNGHYQKKQMSRAQVTEKEEQAGYALACRVYPLSDMQVEIIAKAIK